MHAVHQVVGAPALRRLCAASLDPELYRTVSERTLETLQEVFDECADAEPHLNLDVEYAVRA